MSPPPLRVAVPGTRPRDYAVHVGEGLLARLGELLAAEMPAHRYALIADEAVADLYADAARASLGAAGLRADLLTFPAGEASKTRGSWTALTDAMLAAGLGRDAAVVALGGGVTGDLAGFTASTYMRGIPFASVPTSLLAMLDSSVGGKTAVDTYGAKNSVGAFHHPALVVIDPGLLSTLPEDHLRAGLAEAVKAAAIRDAGLFAWIERNAAALASGRSEPITRLIGRCIRIKAEVVSADPTERNLRMILNFGHTAGHALEALSDFAVLHGAAVAAGMRIEARMGEAAGITSAGTADRLDGVLAACGLADPLPGPAGAAEGSAASLAPRELLTAATHDKKARRGGLRWVLLETIGSVARGSDGAWSHALDPDDLEAWLSDALRATAHVRDSAP